MMFEEKSSYEKKTFVKIDIEGADAQLWIQLQSQLTNMIVKLLEFNINAETGGTVKQEFERITTNVIQYANAKLEKASIENQKLMVEIEGLLASKAKSYAETRKLNAEAEKIELENITARLRLILGTAKILANTTKNPEMLLFVQSIEELKFIFQDIKLIN